jgi:stearoyl-CoA desaturase (delta-9 desaturase)
MSVVGFTRFKKAFDSLDYADLKDDPVVRWQLCLWPSFDLFMCFVFPACVAASGWGESFLNGMLTAGTLRYCVMLHVTWLVNSAAHLYGERPYNRTIYAAENVVVCAGALGEGWHNWHHCYPYDYAASEHGMSRQYNPTKAWIDLFARLGCVTERKRVEWSPKSKRRTIKLQK